MSSLLSEPMTPSDSVRSALVLTMVVVPAARSRMNRLPAGSCGAVGSRSAAVL